MHFRQSNFKSFPWIPLEALPFGPSVYRVPAYSTMRTLLLQNLMKPLGDDSVIIHSELPVEIFLPIKWREIPSPKRSKVG